MSGDKYLIKMIREQYEHRIYATLLEMEIVGKGGKILLDAGLEVTNKKGEKFTVQSVQKTGKEVTISLISPENVTGPITSGDGTTQVSPGQQPLIYSLEDFEKNFEV